MAAPPDLRRGLTLAETHYARQVFGDDLNYGLPKVVRGYWGFFQPSDTAMTPSGDMYYPPRLYRDDFTRERGDFFLFIHELTHCWQHQHGINVMVRGAVERTYQYGEVGKGKTFLAYNVEQQASIVADYVRLRQGVRPVKGTGQLAAYQALIPFLPGGRR